MAACAGRLAGWLADCGLCADIDARGLYSRHDFVPSHVVRLVGFYGFSQGMMDLPAWHVSASPYIGGARSSILPCLAQIARGAVEIGRSPPTSTPRLIE